MTRLSAPAAHMAVMYTCKNFTGLVLLSYYIDTMGLNLSGWTTRCNLGTKHEVPNVVSDDIGFGARTLVVALLPPMLDSKAGVLTTPIVEAAVETLVARWI